MDSYQIPVDESVRVIRTFYFAVLTNQKTKTFMTLIFRIEISESFDVNDGVAEAAGYRQ